MIEWLDDQLFLVEGSCLLRDLHRLCGFAIPESKVYAMMAGFLVTQIHRQLCVVEAVDLGGWRYTIAQVTSWCIVKVYVARLCQDESSAPKVNK
jgi:CBS domain containing-hemolysin-like protein